MIKYPPFIHPWGCKAHGVLSLPFFPLLLLGIFLPLIVGWIPFALAQDKECRELLSTQKDKDGSVMEATETVEVGKTLEILEIPETVGVVEMDRTLETVKTVESVKVGEKDKLKDGTERFLSYLGHLLEENILQDKHLLFMQEGLKKGKIENPLSETEAGMEMKTYIHWEGLATHLEGSLDSTRIGDWVEAMLGRKALEREQRKVVRETTKEVPELVQKFKITNFDTLSSIKLKDGRIWMSSMDGRVWMFHPDGSVYKDFQVEFLAISFLELEDGRVWVISMDGHVSIRHSDGSLDRNFDFMEGKLNPFSKFPHQQIRWSVFKLKDGRIWINTYDKRVYIYNADGSFYRKFKPSSIYNKIKDLLELSSGNILLIIESDYYASTYASIRHPDGSVYRGNLDGSLYDDFQSDQILIDFFLKLQDGRFWIFKNDHVFMYNVDGSASGNFKFNLDGRDVRFAFELTDGKIWVGLKDGNVYIRNTDGSAAGDFQARDYFLIRFLLELKDGRLLFALNDGHVFIHHADGSADGDFQIGPKKYFGLTSLFELPDGKVFAITRDGDIHILDLDVTIDLFRTEAK